MERLSPLYRTPLTDIGDDIINHQLMGECANFELKAAECIEAYGLDRGKKKCLDFINDLRECTFKEKQFKRVELMKAQRDKLIKEGKLDKNDTKYDPQIGSYG